MVEGGGHLHDAVVLDVEVEVAADATEGADRGRDRLGVLVPRAVAAHLVFGGEDQCSRRADADAVAAVDACRLGEGDVVFGGDGRGEAPTGDVDGEGVLCIGTAGCDASEAHDALVVVAYVEVVLDLDLVGASPSVAEPIGIHVVPLHLTHGLRFGEREIDGRRQQFVHGPARLLDAWRVGGDVHALGDLTGA